MEGARIILLAQIDSEKNTEQILVTFDPQRSNFIGQRSNFQIAPIALKIGL